MCSTSNCPSVDNILNQLLAAPKLADPQFVEAVGTSLAASLEEMLSKLPPIPHGNTKMEVNDKSDKNNKVYKFQADDSHGNDENEKQNDEFKEEIQNSVKEAADVKPDVAEADDSKTINDMRNVLSGSVTKHISFDIFEKSVGVQTHASHRPRVRNHRCNGRAVQTEVLSIEPEPKEDQNAEEADRGPHHTSELPIEDFSAGLLSPFPWGTIIARGGATSSFFHSPEV